MANTQKFLDEKGVQHLWSKISMEDYPNNDTLTAVINAIDQSKADKDNVVFISDEGRNKISICGYNSSFYC